MVRHSKEARAIPPGIPGIQGEEINESVQSTTSSLDPTNYLTSYTYDVLDNLKTVNQGSQTRTFVYDGLSRVTSQTTPEAGTVTFTYTSFSAVQTRTDARGVITTYGYDALNRPQTVSYNTSAAPLVAATSGVTIAYKTTAPGKGQVSSVTDGLGSESYAFDTLGRVSSKTRTIDTRSYQTQYLYNNANQMTHLIYPSGKRVRVNRDTRGRMSGTDKVDASNNVLGTYVSGVTYRVEGIVSGLSLGNGVNESYGYSNDRLQMTSQTATKGSTLMSLNYSYAASAGASGVGTTAGNSGQLMSIAAGSTINGQARNQAFTYDNVGRLVTGTGWSTWGRRFSYDRWGNRTGMWDAVSGGSQLQNIAIATTGGIANNRIATVNGVTYTYDASGNCTADGAHSYQYDAEHRQANVDSGATSTAGYDPGNRRLKKVAAGQTTHYVWEGAQVIAEYNGSTGALISEYIFAGSRMIARDQGGALRYYHQDRLSTRLITDGSGTVMGTEDHLPFGEEAGFTGETEKHRFTSYERDTESATDYAVNRQYQMANGRFTRPDPFEGSYDLGNPQSLNRYSYVINDPVGLVDPTGEFINPESPRGPSPSGDSEWGPIGPTRSGSPAPWRTDHRDGAGRTQRQAKKAERRVKNNYDDCVRKVFGNGSQFPIPSASAAQLSLLAGSLDPNLSAMVAAIWQFEAGGFNYFPTGDNGPMQLTSWWSRNHPELILGGAYDQINRRGANTRLPFSPNPSLGVGDPVANIITGGNIVRFLYNHHGVNKSGDWSRIPHFYGPNSKTWPRQKYTEQIMPAFEKYKQFFDCLKNGA